MSSNHSEKSDGSSRPNPADVDDADGKAQTFEDVLAAYPEWLETYAGEAKKWDWHAEDYDWAFAVHCVGPDIAAVALAVRRVALGDSGILTVRPETRAELVELLVRAVLHDGFNDYEVEPDGSLVAQDDFHRVLDREGPGPRNPLNPAIPKE